jgi:carbon starvation protein
MIVAFVMLFAAIGVIRRALANPEPTVHEAEAIYRDPAEIKPTAHH